MKFTLEIDCDNAAFEGQDIYNETASILQQTARRIAETREYGSLSDINGNHIGGFKFVGDLVEHLTNECGECSGTGDVVGDDGDYETCENCKGEGRVSK